MLILLSGSDTYRSSRKLREIVDSYREKYPHALNLREFDCANGDFFDFKGEICALPMFHEKKLLVVKGAFEHPQFQEDFLKEGSRISQNPDLIIIFFEKREVALQGPFALFLKKEGKAQEFHPLQGKKLGDWILKEFGEYGLVANEGAVQLLKESRGDDLWRMYHEIRKIAAFKRFSPNPLVTQEDAELFLKPKLESDIFSLVDAIASRNRKQALALLHEHLSRGVSPFYLLSMINLQFRNLLLVKDLGEQGIPATAIAKEIGLHPFVAKKSSFFARNFSRQQLTEMYEEMFEADLALKTGKRNEETVLDSLIFSLRD